jgi:replicative DNA helicase Mcm
MSMTIEVDKPQEFFMSKKYWGKLNEIALHDKTSLVVDFEDILLFDTSMAKDVIEKPDETLFTLSKAARSQMGMVDPEYAHDKIFVRITNLPSKISLRDIRVEHSNRLVAFDGIVVSATIVKPFLVKGAFRCKKCDAMVYVEQSEDRIAFPGVCTDCKSRAGFTFIEKESVFVNYQELKVQERPEDLPPGQLPHSIVVKLENDLVDSARPGDRVTVVGIVRSKPELLRGGRSRAFDPFIEANFIDTSSKDAESVQITSEDEAKIKEIAQAKDVIERLKQSLAPSLYGYDDIKEAVLYMLFGGNPKELPDGTRVRGDINILIVGDPGIGKSALLKYVARLSPRGIYTSGRGSTAAGLTAAVVKNERVGMALEAGALVLADKGIACIDEIDKMRPEDRVAMHEAMEQQTVSVAKGGIVATLNARASVLAAANPSLGRYDPYKLITENINLPPTLLSRFDLIFVLKDVPEKAEDEAMTKHIIALHRFERTGGTPIPQTLLKKYIAYARRLKPKLTEDATSLIEEFYLKMRMSAKTENSPMPITPRQLESLIRLAEARAKAHLRNEVLREDVEAAIRLMDTSLKQAGIDVATGLVDIDVIMTGKPKSLREKISTTLEIVKNLQAEIGPVEEDKVITELMARGINEEEARKTIEQCIKEGLLHTPKIGYIMKT